MIPISKMTRRISARDLAYCGLLGAAALLLPVLFHLVRLGHVFMPMYLPLVTLPFFVRPLPAAVTAIMTPLISAVVTGMPPLYPPVAEIMGIEIASMAVIIGGIRSRWPRWNEWLVLIPTLLVGRVIYLGLVFFIANWIELPAGFMVSLSLLSGWPGIILMILVVPAIARMGRRSVGLDDGGRRPDR